MKLKFDEPLSTFAFEFNLRRYIKALELLEEWGMQLRIIEYSQVGAYTRPLFGLS